MDKIAASWIITRRKNNRNELLLIKRWKNASKYPNYWSLVWWKQEEWESLKQTAIREVKEEVDLIFFPEKLYYSSKNSWFELNRFLWTWEWDIKIKEDEVQDHWWYIYSDIIKLQIAFDNIRVIELLKNDWLID